jgi:hypothetical protein
MICHEHHIPNTELKGTVTGSGRCEGCAKRTYVVGQMNDKDKSSDSGQVCVCVCVCVRACVCVRVIQTMVKLKRKINLEIYNLDVFKIPLCSIS